MKWLIENFKEFNKNPAIVFKNTTYSYDMLLKKVEEIKNNVINEINSNDVVSIVSDYSFESIALFLALYNNSNVIVPITSTIQSEIDLRIEESFSNKIISIKNGEFNITSLDNSSSHTMIEQLNKNNNAGLVLFSSGSTGKPKAMIHNLDNLIDSFKDKKAKSINMIVFLMFDHIGGLNTMFNILSMGATMVIPENRNADDVCQLLQDYKIMVLPSSPTFLNLILMSKANERYDLSKLRMITYGTEAMPESLLQKLKVAFPKVKLLQTFGTSETGIATTSSKSSDSTFMKIADLSQEYKIVENELWLRSKTQIMGYLNASMESFTDDGWFKTGDLVEQTEDGYLKIIGRSKEVINVGGQKVLPIEVESVLLSMDEISDVMVYGEENIITNQTVVCDVVLNDNNLQKSIKSMVRKYCKDKLDSYKIPTKVNVVDRTNFSDRFKKIRRKS